MACRCVDITNYKMDICKLGEAEEFAQSLASDTSDVRSVLEDLKSGYDGTVIVTDGLAQAFSKLDEGAGASAQGIIAQIKGAKRTVEVWLEEAQDEDEAFHAAEKNNFREELYR